jgi:thiol-disulfide isomerase/thioredoxin
MLKRALSTFGCLAALGAFASPASAAQTLGPGQPMPAFTYRLLDGRLLRPAELRGHPYVLWMVATWCPSCQTGSNVVGSHIALLRQRGVRVVEMELANNLGAAGPKLEEFRKAAGMAGAAPNWYWGELTQAQTLALDSKGDMDVYYLVDARGDIVGISGNPATTWDTIDKFASTTDTAAVGR